MSAADVLCSLGGAGGLMGLLAICIAGLTWCDGSNKTALVFAVIGLLGAGSCGSSVHACQVAKTETTCTE